MIAARLRTSGVYFNPLLPCGRRLSAMRNGLPTVAISIHSSRAGGDVSLPVGCLDGTTISIHSSRAGGDQGLRAGADAQEQFQSTPPVREETSPA